MTSPGPPFRLATICMTLIEVRGKLFVIDKFYMRWH